MKRRAAVFASAVAVLLLTSCASSGPSFAENCAALGGSVMSDSTTRTVTGTVIGNGGVGVGTGTVTVTVSLCLTDSGSVLDMDVT